MVGIWKSTGEKQTVPQVTSIRRREKEKIQGDRREEKCEAHREALTCASAVTFEPEPTSSSESLEFFL